MPQDVSLMKGDTFLLRGLYKDANGNPVDLLAGAISITCVVRTPDGLSEIDTTTTIDPDQAANKGKFVITSDTSTWPVYGCYSVKLTFAAAHPARPGQYRYSQRFHLVVLQ